METTNAPGPDVPATSTIEADEPVTDVLERTDAAADTNDNGDNNDEDDDDNISEGYVPETREQYEARQQAWQESLSEKPEYKAIYPLVSDDNDDERFTPFQAVQQIVQLTYKAASENFQSRDDNILGNQLYATACATLEVVSRTSSVEKLAKVAEFVRQLKATQVPDARTMKEGGRFLTYDRDYDGEAVWGDLPTFGYTFVDEICAFSPGDPEARPREKARWENLVTFIAMLSEIPTIMDFSNWSTTDHYVAFGPFNEDHAAPVNEGPVRSVALWFLHAGNKLWNNVQVKRNFDHNGEGEGLNMKWWEDARKGFWDAQERYTDESTQKLIRRALERMKNIEDATA